MNATETIRVTKTGLILGDSTATWAELIAAATQRDTDLAAEYHTLLTEAARPGSSEFAAYARGPLATVQATLAQRGELAAEGRALAAQNTDEADNAAARNQIHETRRATSRGDISPEAAGRKIERLRDEIR